MVELSSIVDVSTNEDGNKVITFGCGCVYLYDRVMGMIVKDRIKECLDHSARRIDYTS